jgi:hypothetical protein
MNYQTIYVQDTVWASRYNGNVIADASWANLAALNQSLGTTAKPTFAGLNVVGGDVDPAVGAFVKESVLQTAVSVTATAAITRVAGAAANVTVTLPAAAGAVVGRTYTVLYYSTAGATSVTIAPAGADTIGGSVDPIVLSMTGYHLRVTCMAPGTWAILA